MIDLRLNKKRLNQHWHYYRVRYVIFLVAALFAANLLFSMTRPQTPADKKVEIIVVSGAVTNSDVTAWESELLCLLPPDQKEASVQQVTLIEGQEYTIYQAVAARMSAQEGTMWVMPSEMYKSMASQGAFVALDGEMDSFRLPEGTDLAAGKVLVKLSEDDPGSMQLCGIPLDKAVGLAEGFLPEGMVLAFPVYADSNYENAKIAANWLLAKTGEPKFDTGSEPEVRVNIAVAALYVRPGLAGEWEKGMAAALPEGQEVNVRAFAYHLGRESTVAGAIESLKADEAQGYGLCIVPSDVFTALARKGALRALEGDFAALGLPEGIDLSAGEEAIVDKKGNAGATQQYGIPLDSFAGLSDYFNPRGMVLAFPAKPGLNHGNAAAAAKWLLTVAGAAK